MIHQLMDLISTIRLNTLLIVCGVISIISFALVIIIRQQQLCMECGQVALDKYKLLHSLYSLHIEAVPELCVNKYHGGKFLSEAALDTDMLKSLMATFCTSDHISHQQASTATQICYPSAFFSRMNQ